MKRYLLLIFIVSLHISCSEIEESPLKEKKVELYKSDRGNSLEISLPSDNLTSSDSVSIEISLKYKNEYIPQFPDWDLLKDSLNIIEIEEYPATEGNDGLINRTIVLRLDNLIPGEYILNPLEFTFFNNNSAEDTISSDYISLKINSVLLDDSNDLIENLEPVEAENHTLKYIAIVLTILLAAGLGIFAIIHLLKSPKTADLNFKIPYELRIKQCSIEKGQTFYSRLSGILKEYLDNTLFLSVQSQTTEEFISICRTSPQLEDWLKEQLFDFLIRSDAVSFGNSHVSEEQMNGDIQFCLDFIHFIEEKIQKEVAIDI